MTQASPKNRRTRFWLLALVVLFAVTAVVAWSRVGMLNLPAPPDGLTFEDAGFAGLKDMQAVDHLIKAAAIAEGPDALPATADDAVRAVVEGLRRIRAGDTVDGLERMREGIRLDPDNLVLANAYRMETFRLRRAYLKQARAGLMLTAEFPPHLEKQPILFFEGLVADHPSRETRLHLALAWVDLMLLFPALEIKAPASVESVSLLTEILDGGDPGYVPALFARGLNHLHRPARLVWPEAAETPIDAAVQDIGRCVAIGRMYDVGSDRLRAGLAVALGDAYVKTGRYDVARSWWQIAQNLCADDHLRAAVRRRYAWTNDDMLDCLEAELDRSRADLGRPLSDLSFMWN
jgi:hypothetical protein